MSTVPIVPGSAAAVDPVARALAAGSLGVAGLSLIVSICSLLLTSPRSRDTPTRMPEHDAGCPPTSLSAKHTRTRFGC